MARRKTLEDRELENELKGLLNELGRKITVISSRNSKISKLQKDHLRDSANYRVKPYQTLTVSQYKYGKYNTPKGYTTPNNRNEIKNTPLLNSIKENLPEGVNVVVKELTKMIKSPVVKQ